MDADALATVALVWPVDRTLALVEKITGAACRVVDIHGAIITSPSWRDEPARLPVYDDPPPAGHKIAPGWPVDWRLELFYEAPEREERETEFRAPYMALWVIDLDKKRIRTLYMVGRKAKWQRENFMWWDTYRDIAEKTIDLRSEPTAPSGQYAVIWDGRDDNRRFVPPGKYVIHIETSRERGRHTHRKMEIEIGQTRFSKALSYLRQSGSFRVVFGHPNDRFER